MKIYNIIQIEKDNNKLKHEKIYAWLSVIVTTIIFSIVLLNKYFPVTEGWFQDYARYILNGKFIYRDFYI